MLAMRIPKERKSLFEIVFSLKKCLGITRNYGKRMPLIFRLYYEIVTINVGDLASLRLTPHLLSSQKERKPEERKIKEMFFFASPPVLSGGEEAKGEDD
jgi:hypothetical protein